MILLLLTLCFNHVPKQARLPVKQAGVQNDFELHLNRSHSHHAAPPDKKDTIRTLYGSGTTAVVFSNDEGAAGSVKMNEIFTEPKEIVICRGDGHRTPMLDTHRELIINRLLHITGAILSPTERPVVDQ